MITEHRYKPLSVEELTQRNVETVLKLEEAAKEQRTRTDRVAEVIANFCGSLTFVWVHVAWREREVALELRCGIYSDQKVLSIPKLLRWLRRWTVTRHRVAGAQGGGLWAGKAHCR